MSNLKATLSFQSRCRVEKHRYDLRFVLGEYKNKDLYTKAKSFSQITNN